jgi:CheY-like chemotaxis protein
MADSRRYSQSDSNPAASVSKKEQCSEIASEAIAPIVAVSRRTIVVVAEDDPLIRTFAAEVLTDAGFQVIEVTGAAEAISCLETHHPEVCVLFTDIHMPGGVDGLELAHHARGKWPDIGVLVTSGRRLPERSALPPECRFLAKPYDLSHVVKHVRELAAIR